MNKLHRGNTRIYFILTEDLLGTIISWILIHPVLQHDKRIIFWLHNLVSLMLFDLCLSVTAAQITFSYYVFIYWWEESRTTQTFKLSHYRACDMTEIRMKADLKFSETNSAWSLFSQREDENNNMLHIPAPSVTGYQLHCGWKHFNIDIYL